MFLITSCWKHNLFQILLLFLHNCITSLFCTSYLYLGWLLNSPSVLCTRVFVMIQSKYKRSMFQLQSCESTWNCWTRNLTNGRTTVYLQCLHQGTDLTNNLHTQCQTIRIQHLLYPRLTTGSINFRILFKVSMNCFCILPIYLKSFLCHFIFNFTVFSYKIHPQNPTVFCLFCFFFKLKNS